jgi:hypothetical protein
MVVLGIRDGLASAHVAISKFISWVKRHFVWGIILGIIFFFGIWKEPVYTGTLTGGVIMGVVAVMRRKQMASRGIIIWCIIAIGLITWKPMIIHVISHGEVSVTLTKSPDERLGERLIYTDSGTFRVADVPLAGQFRASDVWGKFDRGKTCQIEYYGLRSGWFSLYPTVIDARC